MTAPSTTPMRGATNRPVELARYTIAGSERVIQAQRVLGTVRLVDLPAAGDGRRYVIERELTVMAELNGILEDYLDQVARYGVIPAAGCCALTERIEELLA